MTQTIRLNKEKKYETIFSAVIATLAVGAMIYYLWNGILENIFLFLLSAMYSFMYLTIALRLWKNPRVVINEESIAVYGNLIQPSMKLNWDTITAISYGSYQIDFEVSDETSVKSLTLNSSFPEISIDVKEAIAGVATTKGIIVHGG